ncbi:DUF2252 domain-containing protein [Rathayibacter soli]|uniref:DUF2252 domain-containing protein n=1 Tax=Rathayibacter soli TaxID=3144168 RepID=UPI0027E400A9|nr:DUF2252 domain-containing protein [Glaciibacter superstes]
MDEPQGRLRFDHEPVVTQTELTAQGRAARGDMQRSAHGVYVAAADRDPLGILARQHQNRLPDLVPLRIERMLQNPFAFYRGTAAIQVADLAPEGTSGVQVALCGDAHIANFGLFASPQRTMVFDLNDFDEAAYGPWEWDLKRFVTSVVIAAQYKGLKPGHTDTAALRAAAAYRLGLRQMFELGAVDRYYVRADVKKGDPRFHPSSQKVIDQALKSAKRRTSERVIAKITEHDADGNIVIVEDPPTLTHVKDRDEQWVLELIERYRATVAPDISVLLSQYTITDLVRRVVGVGSVGTRCYIVVLTGAGGEPLVLQVKEAVKSALVEFGGATSALAPEVAAPVDQHGFRVVANQRILQAVSDPFLGYLDDGEHAYYVRQFRDQNVSIDAELLHPRGFIDYVDACGTALARAHAQSPQAAYIAGYLGSNTTFDDAIVQWAMAYAEQSQTDYKALKSAVKSGRFG